MGKIIANILDFYSPELELFLLCGAGGGGLVAT